MTDHRPQRPSWRCADCGEDWPCDWVRKDLAAHHDPAVLVSHLGWLADRAAADLGLSTPAMLYRRFFAWTVGRDRICRICASPRHDVLPGLPLRMWPCDTAFDRTPEWPA